MRKVRGNRTRSRILTILQAEHGHSTQRALAMRLGIDRHSFQYHLRVLVAAGLLVKAPTRVKHNYQLARRPSCD